MQQILDWLDGKKTYLVAIVTILYAIVIMGIQNGDWQGAFEAILAALGFSGLRAGVKKSAPDASK